MYGVRHLESTFRVNFVKKKYHNLCKMYIKKCTYNLYMKVTA